MIGILTLLALLLCSNVLCYRPSSNIWSLCFGWDPFYVFSNWCHLYNENEHALGHILRELKRSTIGSIGCAEIQNIDPLQICKCPNFSWFWPFLKKFWNLHRWLIHQPGWLVVLSFFFGKNWFSWCIHCSNISIMRFHFISRKLYGIL